MGYSQVVKRQSNSIGDQNGTRLFKTFSPIQTNYSFGTKTAEYFLWESFRCVTDVTSVDPSRVRKKNDELYKERLEQQVLAFPTQ